MTGWFGYKHQSQESVGLNVPTFSGDWIGVPQNHQSHYSDPATG